MDHLPLPPGVAPLWVPYVGTDYDNGGFLDYPERQGMSDELTALDFRSKTQVEYQAFFQTWLYFGCVTEVFKILGLTIDTRRFIQDTKWGIGVTSACLNVYIDEWSFRKTYRSEDRRLLIYTQIKSILDKVRETLEGPLAAFQSFLDQHAEVELRYWPNIALSIAVLGWTLLEVSYRMYMPAKDWRQYRWGNHRVLQERFEQSQWCKTEIKHFMDNKPPDFLLYVSSVFSPRATEDHTECTETVCRGRAVNPNEYKTKHVPDCKDEACKLWDMPDSCIDIIKEGGIPLASWSDDGLQVFRYDDEANMSYVAISHVWSDGKGNPERNALPECQLKSLQQRVELLYSVPRRGPRPVLNMFGPRKLHAFRDPWRKPTGFWMDTLCVPVGDMYTALRKQTITQMRQIYESADRVLVLDNWIEELSVSSNIYEKAVRLYLSNWQHRLWTLQEGVMAQTLCIQFQDGQQTIDDVRHESHRTRENESPAFFSYITSGLAEVPIFNLFFAPNLETERIPTADDLFSSLIATISSRTTTKLEDETVCMATLLRLDLKPLLAISAKNQHSQVDGMTAEMKRTRDRRICDVRMEQLLCLVESFEQRIIFNHVPRLSRDGFRWAPRSALGQSLPFLVRTPDSEWDAPTQSPKAKILSEPGPNVESDQSEAIEEFPERERGGLLVTYPGIRLRSVTPSQLQDGTFDLCREGHSAFRYRISLSLPSEDNGEQSLWSYKSDRYALVTSGVLNKGSRQPIPSILGVLRGRTKAGIRKLRHLCVATVYAPEQAGALVQTQEGDGQEDGEDKEKEEEEGEAANNETHGADKKDQHPPDVVMGSWLISKNHQWCIL